MLQSSFEKRNSSRDPNVYSDIYDGALYTELFENHGFLSYLHNISFTWYSDGIKIFKSGKYNIWPFIFVINELPYEERYKMKT